jgi:hypothetical protein
MCVLQRHAYRHVEQLFCVGGELGLIARLSYGGLRSCPDRGPRVGIRDAKRTERSSPHRVEIVHDAQQHVLGAKTSMAKRHCLTFRPDDRLTGAIRKPLEHQQQRTAVTTKGNSRLAEPQGVVEWRFGISCAQLGISTLVILLGLVLIALAAGFTADVFLQNHRDIDVKVLGHTFNVHPGWIVIAGIGALAVFVVGARLLALGVRRARRRKGVLRDAQSAARDRDQLAQELAAERKSKDETAKDAERGADPVDTVTSRID